MRTLHAAKAKELDRNLFSRLRALPTHLDVRRIEYILNLLADAQMHLADWRKDNSPEQTRMIREAGKTFRARIMRKAESAFRDSLWALEDALSRYHWRSTITGDIDGFREELTLPVKERDIWTLEGLGLPDSRETKYGTPWEYAIVRMLLEMLRHPDQLARIRRCSECRQWFYAVTGHQVFCGAKCKKRFTSQSPAFKEKRRIYMREQYRPMQKELERKALARARKAKANVNLQAR